MKKSIILFSIFISLTLLASCNFTPSNEDIPPTQEEPVVEPDTLFTVTFITNLPATYSQDGLTLSGSISPIKVKDGENISSPDIHLTYQNVEMTFGGWKTSNGTTFDFSQPITSNLTLYGNWESTESDGTWYVFDYEGLKAWNEATMSNLTASLVLFNDITITNQSWTPAGNGGSYYGTIDGNDHKIIGLKVESTSTFVGFIGNLNGGVVNNLILEDCNISAVTGGEYDGPFDYAYVGSIAGMMVSGTITDCNVQGSVSSEFESSGGTGGIVGDNSNLGFINITSFSGEITGQTGIGGIAGRNDGIITFSTADVEMNTPYGAGGIVFSNYGQIVSCSSSGNIGTESTAFPGGIASGNYGIIRGCHSTAFISGNNPIGGIAASNNLLNGKGTIVGCYFSGRIQSAYGEIGGISGTNSGNIIGCYSTGNQTSSATSYYNGGIAGKNTGNIYACYSIANVIGAVPSGIVGLNSGTVSYCLWQNNSFGVRYDSGTTSLVSEVSESWINSYPLLNAGIALWNESNPDNPCDMIFEIDRNSSNSYPYLI